jgi:hypothetical protein
MSHRSPLKRRVFGVFVLSIACLLSAGVAAGQNPFKWMVGGDKNVKYETFKDPSGRFDLEYPIKDWKLLPSGGSSLAVFARNDGPTLFVDSVRLREKLTAGEIEAMPEMEVNRLKDQQPKAKGFKTDLLESRAGRGVLIQYARESKGPEIVIQYSIPVEQNLYRLSGVSPEKQLSKYEPVIMHMIQSFKAPSDPSASKPTP